MPRGHGKSGGSPAAFASSFAAPLPQVLELVVEPQIARVPRGGELPRPHGLQNGAALFLRVAAANEAAAVQIGREVQKGLRQPLLQRKPKLVGIKGGKAGRVDDLRAAGEGIQLHMARGVASASERLTDLADLHGKAWVERIEQARFPNAGIACKGRQLAGNTLPQLGNAIPCFGACEQKRKSRLFIDGAHLSPETPVSLLEQGEAYAAALDVFSDRFEIPDAAGTESPTQENGRSNFRQEASRCSFVTEDVTDHDTGKYAPSSEGSAPPNGTDRSGQEHRYRTHQHGNKYQQRFQEAAQAEEQAAQKEKGMDSEPPKTSKLEFTADELPPETKDKKLTHARRKAERTAQKAEQAQNRLPARKKLRMETVSDPETGKAKKHLKFEKEVKSQKVHVKGPVPLRPVKAGANTAIGYAHKKIYEAEDENVGIKAAHRSELVGEAGLRTAYHRHKTAPYRKAAKLQQKSAKANARLAYRQALSDHPELKKHAIARIWQKQKLKRQYAKAAREAGKQAKNAAPSTRATLA